MTGQTNTYDPLTNETLILGFETKYRIAYINTGNKRCLLYANVIRAAYSVMNDIAEMGISEWIDTYTEERIINNLAKEDWIF